MWKSSIEDIIFALNVCYQFLLPLHILSNANCTISHQIFLFFSYAPSPHVRSYFVKCKLSGTLKNVLHTLFQVGALLINRRKTFWRSTMLVRLELYSSILAIIFSFFHSSIFQLYVLYSAWEQFTKSSLQFCCSCMLASHFRLTFFITIAEDIFFLFVHFSVIPGKRPIVLFIYLLKAFVQQKTVVPLIWCYSKYFAHFADSNLQWKVERIIKSLWLIL